MVKLRQKIVLGISERMFQKFDEHIKKSVPHYEGMHDLIANLSDFF